MVNNSTNINKKKKAKKVMAKNLPKSPQQKNLNSDGQQFHKYQHNKESLNRDGQQFH